MELHCETQQITNVMACNQGPKYDAEECSKNQALLRRWDKLGCRVELDAVRTEVVLHNNATGATTTHLVLRDDLLCG